MARSTDPLARPGVAAPAATLRVDGGAELELVRGEDGIWRFADTGIEVPGASDRTVADIAEILVIAPPAGDPQAVLVPRSQVEAHSALAWVPAVGTLLRGGAEERFEVPWPVWQERSGVPVDLRAPERDEKGIRRRMAAVEREVRFARWELERLIQRRARLVAIGAALGMSRREMSEVLGVSAGRVQQLIEDLSPAARADVDSTLRDAVKVLRAVGEEVAWRGALAPDAIVDELLDLGLLEEVDGGVRSTEAGDRAEVHLRAAEQKDRRSRG